MARLFQNHLNKWRIQRNRLVSKDGICNIEFSNVGYGSRFSYMSDIWATLLEIHWTFLMFFYSASFVLSWFLFGLLWYWIGRSNGDLLWQNPPANHSACVINVCDMTSAFLYSLETQTFIAYGMRVITTLCPGAVTVYVLQVIFGTVITCFCGGVVLGKISLPQRRTKAIMFSKTAVICSKQEALCLKIRVANLRKSLMIGTKIYGKLIRAAVTPQNETLIMDQVSVNFSVETGKENPFFICPLTLYHVIDKSSPFFELTSESLQLQDFELVVFLDGTAESTSFSCQVRTSYLPKEIMWGYRFLPIISKSEEGRHCVVFSNFAKVEPVLTPHCALCINNEKVHHRSHSSGAENGGFEMND